MSNKTPLYDLSHPNFKRNGLYRRLAKEHMNLADLDSEVIDIEISSTRGPQRVPDEYVIHYRVKSIVAVDEYSLEPIYGNHHKVRITLPHDYPLRAAEIYMVSEAWHPNIQGKGKFKGRVCGNTRDFGKSYELYQLVIRIGEILQYKNYHALNEPPYPEDSDIAKWIVDYAEPKNIVNKYKRIFTDYSPLIKGQVVEQPILDENETIYEPEKTVAEPEPEPPVVEPEPPVVEETPPAPIQAEELPPEPEKEEPADKGRPKLKLKSKSATPPPAKKSSIKIKKR
ncbi:MAG: ubiquitin-conjugating enzyme E2 [Bacteroidota bacterium]